MRTSYHQGEYAPILPSSSSPLPCSIWQITVKQHARAWRKEWLGRWRECSPSTRATSRNPETTQSRNDATQSQEQDLTIFLTGSTGSLGSYALDCLLANKQVTKVICLNRGTDSEIKQKKGNKTRGLIAERGERVQFLTTDLSKASLGLGVDD